MRRRFWLALHGFAGRRAGVPTGSTKYLMIDWTPTVTTSIANVKGATITWRRSPPAP